MSCSIGAISSKSFDPPSRDLDKWALRRVIRHDVRDAVLFITGLVGVIHEALYVEKPRETLLLLFAAMMGLPAFLRWDEQNERERKENGGAP